jgi:hypothetical protein
MKLQRISALAFALALTFTAFAADGGLSAVHKIYVGDFGAASGASGIRETIKVRLVQSGKVTVVENVEEADAVLSGLGGQSAYKYYRSAANVNIYGGSAGASAGTTYSANATAELRNRSGEILWAGEGSTGQFRSVFSKNEPATSKAAGKIVNQLLKALDNAHKGSK